jgi:diaminobutyrate-2-oxoglutarate transaminase
MILEVVQGEGGVIPASDAWFQEIRRITQARAIPLIVDEVQTGLGRTGRLCAFGSGESGGRRTIMLTTVVTWPR